MADSTVTLVGNLTRDPELRFTQSGQAIATLGIARKTFYDKLQRHGINRADYVRSGTA